MGSVSIIDFRKWPRHLSVDTADLTSFDGTMLDPGIVIAAGKLRPSTSSPSTSRSPMIRSALAHDPDANAVARSTSTAEGHIAAGARLQGSPCSRQRPGTSDRDNSINLCMAGPPWDVPARRDCVLPPPRPDVPSDGERRRLRAADEAQVSAAAITLGPGFPPSSSRTRTSGA